MKVQKIKLNAYDYSWLVLDNNHLPVKPITDDLGDALHWESLLSHVEKGKNLIIISNDSDFIDDLYLLRKKAHSFLE